jgi:hypothetical protein
LQFLQVLQVFFWFILWWQNPVGAASVCLARLTLIWQILANPATVLSWQDMEVLEREAASLDPGKSLLWK